jgi:hypothetical protein
MTSNSMSCTSGTSMLSRLASAGAATPYRARSAPSPADRANTVHLQWLSDPELRKRSHATFQANQAMMTAHAGVCVSW